MSVGWVNAGINPAQKNMHYGKMVSVEEQLDFQKEHLHILAC